jgi:hypothetical protein
VRGEERRPSCLFRPISDELVAVSISVDILFLD